MIDEALAGVGRFSLALGLLWRCPKCTWVKCAGGAFEGRCAVLLLIINRGNSKTGGENTPSSCCT